MGVPTGPSLALIRFAYRAVTHAFAALRLLPMNARDKDIEILALRHQIAVLQRQLGAAKPAFRPEDRACLAALLTPLPRAILRRLRLLVQPDTSARCDGPGHFPRMHPTLPGPRFVIGRGSHVPHGLFNTTARSPPPSGPTFPTPRLAIPFA
ncbi:hypothetical protein ACFVZD_35855 [Streptomyces sp. NPDC058287]|uniref:hypothetical protein n=1 Tax=unclassified Streptomyces TaxID=2593676 RepID=UPI0036E75385